MTPATRSRTKKEILNHILHDVMKVRVDDFLFKALDGNGIDSIQKIMISSDSSLANLKYLDTQGVQRNVPDHDIALLRILKAWNYYLIATTGLKRIDWMDLNIVNEDEFEDFIIQTDFKFGEATIDSGIFLRTG